MILLGVPSAIAVGSSEFAMAITNGFGVIAHGLLDNILIDYALPLVIGTVIGAQIGYLLSKRIDGEAIGKIPSIIVFVGPRLAFSFFI